MWRPPTTNTRRQGGLQQCLVAERRFQPREIAAVACPEANRALFAGRILRLLLELPLQPSARETKPLQTARSNLEEVSCHTTMKFAGDLLAGRRDRK